MAGNDQTLELPAPFLGQDDWPDADAELVMATVLTKTWHWCAAMAFVPWLSDRLRGKEAATGTGDFHGPIRGFG